MIFCLDSKEAWYNRPAQVQLSRYLVSKREGLPYIQDVECQVGEWTDNVKIKDELWFCHIILASLLSVGH